MQVLYAVSPLWLSLAAVGVAFIASLILRLKSAFRVVEYALLANVVALVGWETYVWILKSSQAEKKDPSAALAVGIAACTFIAAAKMLRNERVGLPVWVSFGLVGFFSFVFLSSIGSGPLWLPGVLRIPRVISDEQIASQREQNRQYLPFVVLSGIKGGYYKDILYGRSVFAECQIANTGARDIATLTLRASLLDQAGNIIVSEDFFPVSEKSPLLAGRKMHFLARFSSTPKRWDEKRIRIRVSELRLAGNSMLSTAKFTQQRRQVPQR